jgi:large subunit ribosomal protein L10
MTHVAEYKKRIVNKIVDLINAYPIVGVVNVENLPAPQLQRMRAQLRDNVNIFMTKKRLISLALEKTKNSKKGIEKLKEYFKGMPALIFTRDNPFALAKTLKKNKSTAPAKPGQTAPKDIVVQAGPTSFSPGPIIGELGSVGIKTQIDKGKIAIKEDCVVCKEGDKISAALATLLTRLGIEPMEVGLDLIATYENGLIYTKDVLDIDEEKFMSNLSQVGAWAFNLAIEISYPTKDTIELLLSNAFMDAKALALGQNIIADAVVEELLTQAEQQMLSLKSTASIEVPEKKEEAQEKPAPQEEQKEGSKPEVAEIKEEPKPETPAEPQQQEEKKSEEKPQEPKKEEPKQKAPEKREESNEEEHKLQEKPAETPVQKKEEIALEEEKQIIQEEKRLEQPEEAATAIEKEVQEAVKEEEEKKLEQERIEKEKEVEKLESQSHCPQEPKTEKTENIDVEVAKLVEQTKKQAVTEEKSTAEKIVEEVKEESKHEDAEKKRQQEEKKKQQEVEELAKQLMKKGTLRQ